MGDGTPPPTLCYMMFSSDGCAAEKSDVALLEVLQICLQWRYFPFNSDHSGSYVVSEQIRGKITLYIGDKIYFNNNLKYLKHLSPSKKEKKSQYTSLFKKGGNTS